MIWKFIFRFQKFHTKLLILTRRKSIIKPSYFAQKNYYGTDCNKIRTQTLFFCFVGNEFVFFFLTLLLSNWFSNIWIRVLSGLNQSINYLLKLVKKYADFISTFYFVVSCLCFFTFSYVWGWFKGVLRGWGDEWLVLKCLFAPIKNESCIPSQY